uniref:ASCH domain-containing protein n=1 Tax=Siphoviridae sp. ct8WU9 TaxID=2825364 RepID=A0A8S5PS31_9CAUD|nr:MAG TPA: hypothetical protein [Siphoviridae sp. ct8WU9]
MSKAVMLSIRPKWCEKIASGEKTIEVRKTRPKLKTPFRCYIYCTQSDDANRLRGSQGKVIGEFTCERIVPIEYDGGRLWCPTNAAFSPATCLSQAEIIAYIGDKGRCYGWHISNLKIYDTPRELSEFRRACPNSWYCESCAMHRENNGTCGNERLQIKRAPQSWCYVEAMKNV